MATTNNELMTKVKGDVAKNGKKPTSAYDSIQYYLTAYRGKILELLKDQSQFDIVAGTLRAELKDNPALLNCEISSLIICMVKAINQGLSFGTGEAYIVPYGKEAKFMRGYKGDLRLIRRSNLVKNIVCQRAYSNDKFDLQLGSKPNVYHSPLIGGDRGDFLGVYMSADVVGEGTYVEWMSKQEIDAVRNISRAKNNGPWVNHYGEMCRKTVLHRGAKYLPMETEISKAFIEEDKAIYQDSRPSFNLEDPKALDLSQGNAHLPAVAKIEEVADEK